MAAGGGPVTGFYACCAHCEHDAGMPENEHTAACPEGCNDGEEEDR